MNAVFTVFTVLTVVTAVTAVTNQRLHPLILKGCITAVQGCLL